MSESHLVESRRRRTWRFFSGATIILFSIVFLGQWPKIWSWEYAWTWPLLWIVALAILVFIILRPLERWWLRE